MKEFIEFWKLIWNLTPTWMKAITLLNTVLLITAIIAGKVMWYVAYWLVCTIIGGIWGYFFGQGYVARIIATLDAFVDTLQGEEI